MCKLWGVVAAVAVAALPSRAAEAKPLDYDPAVDLQLFQWAIGPTTFFSVASAGVADRHQLSVDGVVSIATDPFSGVVTSETAAQLAVAYGITSRIQLGVALPVIFSLVGNAFDAKTDAPANGGLSVTGIGDLRVELKALLWRRRDLRLAAIVGGTIATSDGTQNAQFTGDNTASGRARVALDWAHGPVALGLNIGGIVRTARDVYGAAVGDDLTYGAAGAYRLTEHFALIAELFGQTAFASTQNPVEVIGGARVFATRSVSVSFGGGAGLTHALGSPTAEFFLGVGVAPDDRDSDGDGIPDSRDKCPTVPEDRDGFQDADGCPDDDNDGDRHPDAVDKCPNQAEDVDGFEDDDGCPDLDNDKDGIPDLEDRCPDLPEDGLPPWPHDGCPASKRDSDGDGIPDSEDQCPLEEEDYDQFEDGDGCPDLDNDGDGIPDAIDKCPLCPEDKDSFQDEDGCPDLDNDNDGIPDARDKCPNEPETVNGYQDEDGCPDTGGKNVARLDGDVLEVDRVPTLAGGGALSPVGAVVVEQMALVMAGHHEVTKWLLAVASPTDAGGQQLGAAIRADIVRRGVTAEVTLVTKVGPAKVVVAVQERRDPAAPPVCPAGMEVHERPDRAAKRGSTPPAP